MRFQLGDKFLFQRYLSRVKKFLAKNYKQYDFKDVDLSFLIDASSVYSSNIEGNSIDLNTFMNYRMNAAKFKKNKEIAEIEDLVKAYKFVETHDFNEKNLLKVHAILSAKFVSKLRQGKYRKEPVGVFGKSGLVYLAAPSEILKKEMKEFCIAIGVLLKQKLSLEESFYFASQIHLVFAHIHPFIDGNGRVVRLLEKWFLAAHLGKNAWQIPVEEFYWKNRMDYYRNLNLGVNYYELNYGKALPFLMMLPRALK